MTLSRKARLFQQREAEIVEAATNLFRINDLDKVSIDQIARQAGIGKGTVYKHFTSKDEILVRIMIDLNRAMRKEISEIHTDLAFRQRLNNIIATIWDHDMRDSQFLRRLNLHLMTTDFRNNLKPEVLEELNQLQAEDNAFYLMLLRDAQQKNEIVNEPLESLLFSVRAAVDGAILHYWQLERTGEVSTSDKARYLTALQNFIYRSLRP